MRTNLFLALISLIIVSCGNPSKEKLNSKMHDNKTEKKGNSSWSKNATIYEVNIRQYTPEGTFNAFSESIPRLKKMGVKILWIMPINPIGVKNRKGTEGSYYSIKDYEAVNPEFGTMKDFRALVEKAHSLDMKVILDWVANHSAFDNVWTVDHKDWYELDSLGNLQPPPGTDWWDVTEFNYDKPEMRAAMINAMKYWIENANVDGYRCDVAEMVPMDFWVQCRDSLENLKSDVFMLAEGQDPELHKAFDMTYAFEFLHLMNGIAKGEKQVSSTVGHQLMHNHPFAEQRFQQANNNISRISKALQNGDLKTFIEIVESEALTLHAMMMTSNPYFILMKPNTLEIINSIWKFREETKSNICFTLDAGANVHVLFPAKEKEIVNKFIKSNLTQFCQENHYICDSIGEGAKQVSNK